MKTTDAIDLPDKGLVCGACKASVDQGDTQCDACGAKFRTPAKPVDSEGYGSPTAGGEAAEVPQPEEFGREHIKIAAFVEPGDFGKVKLAGLRHGNPILRIRLLRAAQKKGIPPYMLKTLLGR